MALRTAEKYVTDLKKLQKEIYMFGEKLDDWTEHPIIKASINAQKVGFELAQLERIPGCYDNGVHLDRRKDQQVCAVAHKHR